MAAVEGFDTVEVAAVNLLRLLRCTEQLAFAPDLDLERELLRAHLLGLHALHRRVNLEGEALSAAQADDCRRRIRLLDELLDAERPAPFGAVPPLLAVARAAAALATAEELLEPGGAEGAELQPRGDDDLRARLFGAASADSAAAAASGVVALGAGRHTARRRIAGKVAGEEASASDQAAIEMQRRAHGALLEDTAELVARLKQNSLAAQRALATDNATLDLTDAAASFNVSRVDAEARRIAETRRRMHQNCCANWLIGIVVLLLFMLTLVFIRLFPAPRRQ
ncbi:hypothetical protein T492DRAFT_911260 [Pavlovales sp. CCMP2436]|nr:hypothetical protein T492DRAFT_911260 [Pavlovales sp. CCMP2436]